MLPHRLDRLVKLFARLPGVGEKTALRFALGLVTEPELAAALGAELAELPLKVTPCERCNNLAELEDEHAICSICRDSRREGTLLCAVAKVQDLLAIERSAAFRGRYFVLGKLLSPLDGVGPEVLPIAQLRRRIEEDAVTELIIATPPSVDGEATALLLARELGQLELRISRIASGVPHGGDLEFADQITLGRALEGRRSIS